MNSCPSPTIRFDTIAARALNASRVVHAPSYAGLRLLIGPASNGPEAFLSFLIARCDNRAEWRYFGFQLLKEASGGRKPVYRNCITGSPLTYLAESYVLALMAAEPAFQPPACAYSYLWPRAASDGRNFEYYFYGYQRRSQRTAYLLRSLPGHVAVVTDIRRFYPSVNKEQLRQRVDDRIGMIANASTGRTIRQVVAGLLDQRGAKVSGLPIGPDLSHLLGHLALESVDKAMEAEFGERYLRYVDDIIIVVPHDRVRNSIGRLRALLDVEGLSLNDDKQDIVNAQVWEAEGWRPFAATGTDAFSELLEDIYAFLLGRPGRAENLHAELRKEGFALPVARLAGQTRSRRFRTFYRRAVWDGRRMLAWMRGLVHDERSIIAKAREVRAELWASAQALAAVPPLSAMRRRWFGQRRRSIYNQLLYLLPPDEYQNLLAVIPEIDEFHDVRTVAGTLASGDVTGILPYPGRIVNTFCQIWPEQHFGRQPQIRWPAAPGRADAESMAHLALKLSVIPPIEVLEAISRHTPGARMLIELCCRSMIEQSSVASLTYLDEMENLFRGVPHEEIQRLLTKRFDESEDIGLEALALGAGGYPAQWDVCQYAN